MLGLYRDNGKENGNYYIGLGFRGSPKGKGLGLYRDKTEII